MNKAKSTKKSAKTLAKASKKTNNQITQVNQFDIERVFFEDTEKKNFKDSLSSSYSVPIGYLNEDGTTGDLIIQTPRLWSYGVSVFNAKKSDDKKEEKKVEAPAYKLSLVLHNRDGPTEEQEKFVQLINDISDKCINHLIEVRKTFKKPDLEARDLRNFNPIWRSKDNEGVVIPTSTPNLSPKLAVNKKTGNILSLFFDDNNEPIDPLTLFKGYGYAECLLRFESIYIGGPHITLQLKVQEVTYSRLQIGFKPMMERRTAVRDVSETTGNTINDVDDDEEENEGSDGSVGKEDGVEEPKEEPKETKKLLKRIKTVKK